MDARHLAERHGDRPRDHGSGDVGEDYGGSGDVDRGAGAEEQTGTDRAADGDHRHLAGGELPAQSRFARVCGDVALDAALSHD